VTTPLPTMSPTLPATGSQDSAAAAIGFWFLAAEAVALVISRRRARGATAAKG